jgi:hypothetical protein
VCRAVKVLCVTDGRERLAEVKRAVVAADWELCEGATTATEAAEQLDAERPHVLIALGPFDELVARARERFPGLRIVTDRELPGSYAVTTSLAQLRDIVSTTSPPRGPVR